MMTVLEKYSIRLLPLLMLIMTACLPPAGGQGADGKPINPTGEMLKMLMFMGFFFVIMWVILIRPQRKQQKEHENLLQKLKGGDRVVASGMVATVVTVKENTVTIRSGDSKIEVLKQSVTEVLKPEGRN